VRLPAETVHPLRHQVGVERLGPAPDWGRGGGASYMDGTAPVPLYNKVLDAAG